MAEIDAENGLIKVDGKEANGLDFVRKVDGNAVTYDLRLRMGRKVVHRVNGVDANEMVHTLGEDNAKTVHRTPGERGSVSGKNLHVHDGLSPAAQVAVIEEAVTKEVAERRAAQEEVALSPERRAFLEQLAAREKTKANEQGSTDKGDEVAEAARKLGTIPSLTSEEVSQRKAAQMEALKKQFILVENRFFYKDRANKLAFEDRGSKLVTAEKDSTVAAAMTKMAEAKGWKSIKVSGAHEFKRQLWIEASAGGLKVQGYTPTDADKAALQQLRIARATNTVERGDDRDLDKAGKGTEKDTPQAKDKVIDGKEKTPPKEKVDELRRRKQRAEDFDQLRDQNREGIPKAAIVGRVAEAILELKVKNPETRERVLSQVQEQLDKMAAGGKVPTLHTYDRNSPAKAREIDKVRPPVERQAERTR
jgi:hypothetical protein